MCGIVGYLGKQKTVNILIDGLRKVKYRGYDSAGLALVNNEGQIISLKSAAEQGQSIDELLQKSADLNFDAEIGIAHTRWATHGKPTKVNAHPHSSCNKEVVLVHNGTVENFTELKESLIEKGHTINTETDTEIIAHLIEEELKNKDLESAVQAAARQIVGDFALAIISKKEPDKIIAVRRTSPLLIGKINTPQGKEFIVASDVLVLLDHTKDIFELEEDQMCIIQKSGFVFKTLAGDRVENNGIKVEEFEKAKGKQGFAHHMISEIFEQPDVLERALLGRVLSQQGLVKLGGLEKNQEIISRLNKIDNVIFLACGTAHIATLLGERYFNSIGLAARSYQAHEFIYTDPVYDPEKTLIIAVSQSGETADTIKALEEAKRRGALTMGIINRVGSRITKIDDTGIYNRAGFEVAVASTKAFTSQVAMLLLTMIYFGRNRFGMSYFEAKRIITELENLPEKMKKVLASNDYINEIVSLLGKYNNYMFLGRGYSFPVALEGALKLKEVSYIHAEGYAAGEMKHGPIAMLDENFPVVVVAPNDGTIDLMKTAIQEVNARSAPLIIITTDDHNHFDRFTDKIIKVPNVSDDRLSPLLTTIPLQLLAYHSALQRGLNPDEPRNLAKSVTVI